MLFVDLDVRRGAVSVSLETLRRDARWRRSKFLIYILKELRFAEITVTLAKKVPRRRSYRGGTMRRTEVRSKSETFGRTIYNARTLCTLASFVFAALLT